MSEVFISKVRPFGTSVGFIVPKEVVKRENLALGEEIHVSIFKRNFKLLDSLIGSVKNAAPFERDRRDRI